MAGLDCKICFNMMDKAAFLPRILLCGHTFCTKCIANILESTTKSCPSCRKEISCEKVDDYPVNYMILDIINSTKDTLDRKLEVRNQYRDQFYKLMEEFEFMKPMIELLHDKYELATKCVEQLNTLLEAEDDFDEGKSEDKIKELGDILEGIHIKITSDLTVINDVSLQCKDFKDVKLLIKEIREGIENNQKFAALLRIDGVKKFARLSFSDRYLCIHSFEDLDEKHDFITIAFQDLLKALLEMTNYVYAFLELCYGKDSIRWKAMVRVFNPSSFLGCRFLKLCTGELGLSYKGREFSQNYADFTAQRLIAVNNIGLDFKDLDMYSQFFLRTGSKSNTTFPDKCFLSFQKDGSFQIFRFNSNYRGTSSWDYVIGSVEDCESFLLNIENTTLRTILDCGIAFDVGL